MVAAERNDGTFPRGDDGGAFPRGEVRGGDREEPQRPRKRQRGLHDRLFSTAAAQKPEASTRTESTPDGDTAKRKAPRRSALEEEFEGELVGFSGNVLSLSRLAAGTRLLGVVRAIRGNSVEVSLPSTLLGYIPRTEVLFESDTGSAAVCSVGEVFQIQKLVQVAVAEVVTSEETGKRNINLTARLEVLNSGLEWRNLGRGFSLYGAVRSVEDHGYVISFGSQVSFTGFLPFEMIERDEDSVAASGSASHMQIGAPIECTVHQDVRAERRQRVVRVSARRQDVCQAVTDVYDGVHLANLRPGALVNATVLKVMNSGGVVLSVFSLFRGRVDRLHVRSTFADDPERPNHRAKLGVGERVRARVLYVDETSKSIGLTLLPALVRELRPPPIPQKYAVGSIIEKATVVEVRTERGVYFEDEGVRLFAHVTRLADQRVDDPMAHFKRGSVHRCRVTGVGQLDGVVLVSLQPSVLRRVAIRYDGLSAGNVVDATIESVKSAGLIVVLEQGTLKALLPQEHMSDAGAGRRLRQKFQPGGTVKVMVLNVNIDRRRVIVTAKKSLLRREYTMPTSYEQAESLINQTVTGFVAGHTKALGVVVEFFNHVCGMISAEDARTASNVSSMTELRETYPRGMTLVCSVLTCESSRRQMRLSRHGFGAVNRKQHLALENVAAGDFIAQGVLEEATECALRVKFKVGEDGTSLTGTLALEHLSDTLSLSRRAFKCYTKQIDLADDDDGLPILEDLLVLDVNASQIVLTNKESLRYGRRNGVTPSPVDTDGDETNKTPLQVGDLYVAYVHALLPRGALVAFVGGLRGFIHNSRIADAFVSEPADYLYVGQSLVVLVESVEDSDRRRVSLSSRRADISGALARPHPFKELDSGHAKRRNDAVSKLVSELQVRHYYEQLKAVQDAEAALAQRSEEQTAGRGSSLELESVRRMLIKSVEPFGAVLAPVRSESDTALSAGAPVAFAVHAQLGAGEGRTSGSECDALILEYDHGRRTADVSLRGELFERASLANSQKRARTLQKGGVVDCTVELAKENEVILSVNSTPKLQSAPLLVYSVYHALNDGVKTATRLRPGMTVRAKVIGEEYSQSGPAASSRTLVALLEGDKGTKLDRRSSAASTVAAALPVELAVGETVNGRVTRVYPMQLNVGFQKAGVGRLHVTESIDEPAQGGEAEAPEAPLRPYSVGDPVSARVAAIREEHTDGALAEEPSKPLVVELTMRSHSPSERPLEFARRLNDRGSRVLGFVKLVKENVLWISVSPTRTGRVNVLDCGVDVRSLQSASRMDGFQVGRPVICYVLRSYDAEDGKRLDLSLVPPVDTTPERVTVIVDKVIEGDSVRVQLPGYAKFGARHGHLRFTDISDDFDSVRTVVETFVRERFVRCAVLKDGKEHDERVLLSTRSSRLEPERSARDHCVADPEVSTERALRPGMRVRGFVKASNANGCFVRVGTDVVARIRLSNLADRFVKDAASAFPAGKLMSGRIVSVGGEGRVEMTMRAELEEGLVMGQPVSERLTGQVLLGEIKSVVDFGVFIRLGENVVGLCYRRNLSDEYVVSVKQAYSAGQRVKCKVLDVDLAKRRIALSMKASDVGMYTGEEALDGEGNDRVAVADTEPSEGDVSASDDEDAAERSDDAEGDEVQMDVEESEDGLEPQVAGIDVGVGFNFDDSGAAISSLAKPENDRSVDSDPDEDEANDPGHGASAADEVDSDDGDDDHDVDSDDPDETTAEVDRRPRQSSKRKRERKKEKAEAEKVLQKQEDELATSAEQPADEEGFQRLLLGMPNSSMVWIRYIAFKLSLSQLEQARDVAERALRTINYRDEKEKMNVWIAYVNLEASYGTRESTLAVFDRATHNVDAKQLYIRMLAALRENHDLANELLQRALAKHRSSKKIWIAGGELKFRMNQPEEARALLARSMLSLAAHKHVPVIVKFAQFEYRFGVSERGRTTFEGVVSNLPKRVDLWGLYLDMEMRLLRTAAFDENDIARVRMILERCSALNLSTKKMKYFFKRFLEFEKTYGSADDVENVKTRAREYVQSKTQ